MAFPTLSRRPVDIDITPEDNVIKSPKEAGYSQRRPRHTRVRNTLVVTYDLLPEADKILLVAHQELVGCHDSFVFTDADGNNYTVYYLSKSKRKRTVTGWWQFAPLTMREV